MSGFFSHFIAKKTPSLIAHISLKPRIDEDYKPLTTINNYLQYCWIKNFIIFFAALQTPGFDRFITEYFLKITEDYKTL